MTPETFKAGINLLTQQWPNHQVNPDVYWHVLRGMDDEAFQRAIVACLETCKFFPVIAEIREKAMQFLNVVGAVPVSAEEAWEQVMAARTTYSPDHGWPVRDPGTVGSWSYGGPSPLAPLVEQAVRALGGMTYIRNAPDHELGFIRRDFLAFYGHKREMEMAYGSYEAVGQPRTRPALTEGLTA